MESLKLCLQAAHASQNRLFLIQICAEIVEFLDQIESRSERKLLTNQLCQISVLLTSIQGITSDIELLMHILKLICYISESENFVEHIWPFLGTITRALAFVINSEEYEKVQGEFIEIIFMVNVLLKRFHGVSKEESIDAEKVRCLRSLVILAGLIFHSPLATNAVKLSIVLLFNQIVAIILALRDVIAKSDGKLFRVVRERLYDIVEFCFEYRKTHTSQPMLFIALKLLLNLASFQDLHPFDQACHHKYLTAIFQNRMWKILFEDVSDLTSADFLITSINSILSLISLRERNSLRKISEKFVKFNGIERLIIFLGETSCSDILVIKTKLLIGIVLSFTTIQHDQNTSGFVKSILLEKMEIFSKFGVQNSAEIYKNAKSFICIFYVIAKSNRNDSHDLFLAILEKLHLIITMKKTNDVGMASDEFRMCLSIYQVCYSYLKNYSYMRHEKESVFAKINELLKMYFEERFCTSSVLFECKEFQWIQRNNESFFQTCVEYNLDQRNHHTSKYFLNNLSELIQPIQIAHLVFSKSYNQIINSSIILASTTLTSDDLNHLLLLHTTCAEIHSTNYLGLFFILHQHVDYLENIEKALTICRQLMKHYNETFSRFDEELKILMFDLIAKIVVKKFDFINVNFFRKD